MFKNAKYFCRGLQKFPPPPSLLFPSHKMFSFWTKKPRLKTEFTPVFLKPFSIKKESLQTTSQNHFQFLQTKYLNPKDVVSHFIFFFIPEKNHFCLLKCSKGKNQPTLHNSSMWWFLNHAFSCLHFIELSITRLVAGLDGSLPSHAGDGRRIVLSAAAGNLWTSNCLMLYFISVTICNT